MKKKKKPMTPEELLKNGESELVRLFGESRREADRLANSYTPNNNGSSNDVTTDGFYWKYKDIYFYNSHYGKDGLEKIDIRKIAGQLEKVCMRCIQGIREDYVLVKNNGERFYVHVNDVGEVSLPELVGSNPNGPRTQRIYGKTDDPEKVLGLAGKTQKS